MYVEHLARSAMELHHKRTGRGMQHNATLKQAADVAKMKRMEEEPIHWDSKGVFVLATGGINSGGGRARGSSGVHGGGEDVTPTKYKGGRR